MLYVNTYIYVPYKLDVALFDARQIMEHKCRILKLTDHMLTKQRCTCTWTLYMSSMFDCWHANQ